MDPKHYRKSRLNCGVGIINRRRNVNVHKQAVFRILKLNFIQSTKPIMLINIGLLCLQRYDRKAYQNQNVCKFISLSYSKSIAARRVARNSSWEGGCCGGLGAKFRADEGWGSGGKVLGAEPPSSAGRFLRFSKK